LKAVSCLASAALLGLLLSGCAGGKAAAIPDAQMSSFLADKPPVYREDYRKLLEEGKNNECLNYMRIGLKAYKQGDQEVALPAFDNALLTIESFFVNTEGAQKARSLWYEEGMKDFKGEPYERVMAYYYRGLMYMNAGDYENARASFKSAVLQDSFAEEEQYRADFALVIFLEGVAARLAGDEEGAKSSFAELKKLRPDFSVPERFNTLFIVETGTAPRKVADGPGHSELKYFRGRNFTEKKTYLKIDGGSAEQCYPMEDIYFQASSRGGRQIDKILKDKVVFRQTNLAIGSTLSETAASVALFAPLAGSNMGSVQAVAGGLAIIGGIQQVMAINAKPHADTRFWDNLPDSVHLDLAQLDPGSHRMQVGALDDKGAELRELAKTVQFSVGADNGKKKGLDIVWVKLR
jgi:tetratricopeptide (TPR) repeat protein